jgi:hypothetical protein
MKNAILLIMFVFSFFGNAQFNVTEGFESGLLPSGWTTYGVGVSVNSTLPIAGSYSLRLSTSTISGVQNVTTSNYTSNGNPMNISFLSKESGFGYVGYEVMYRVNNSSLFSFGLMGRQASTTVATNTFSIPSGSIPAGSLVSVLIRVGAPSNTVSTAFLDNIVVSQQALPTFNPIATQCSGATFVLPTISTNGITGTWFPAINNSATTTYTFTPTAGQNASTTTMTIEVIHPVTPTGDAIQNFTITRFLNKTLSDIVVYPSNVVWYSSIRNAVSGTNPLPNNTVLVSRNTYYAVNVIGNCRSTPFAVTVNITNFSNSNKMRINSDISVFPNPVNDLLNIETSIGIQSVQIFNLQGQKVLSSNQKQINVSELPAGIYLVRIQDLENNIATKKIVIK